MSTNGQPWLFRVASDPRWGGGHVSRCRTLARVLRPYAPVHFALDENDGGWRDRLLGEGFEIVGLDSASDDATRGGYGRGCLLDHYEFDQNQARLLRRKFGPLAFMDDHLSPPDCADLIINPGAHDGTYNTIPALTGLKYALADAAFSNVSRPVGGVKSVLITMGLRDAPNATAVALQIMANITNGRPAPHLVVALGSGADHLVGIRDLLGQYAGQAVIELDVADMPALLAKADIALVAGGISLLECMAAGCPSAVLTTAGNQAANVRMANAAGAILDLGAIQDVDVEVAAKAVSGLFQDRDRRRSLAISGRTAVDGQGAERMARSLMAMRRAGFAADQFGAS